MQIVIITNVHVTKDKEENVLDVVLVVLYILYVTMFPRGGTRHCVP